MTNNQLSGPRLARAICKALGLPQERVRSVALVAHTSNAAAVEVSLLLDAEDLRLIAKALDEEAQA